MRHEEVGQRIHHVGGVELAIDADHQRLPGEFIDDVEGPVGSAVMGAVVDEVIGPDVIRPLRPQPDA